MSHVCGKASLAKDKASNVFYRKIKPPKKDAITTSRMDPDCKCAKCSKSDFRMKKLRTRKERNHIRDGKETSKSMSKSHRHLYSYQISKDVSYVPQCCHNTSTTGAFPNIVPITHEPSVITDSRLLGHHGLFNHEIKSIDIERLLSKQRKQDRTEGLAENSKSRVSNSAVTAGPPLNVRQCSLEYQVEGGNLPATSNYPLDQDNKPVECISQCSDLTPGQKPRKIHNSSIETNKNDKSPKHHSSDAEGTGTCTTQPAVLEICNESHQTPSRLNTKDILPGSGASFIKHTAKKTESAAIGTQTSCPSPLLPSSPTGAEASNILDAPNSSLDSDSIAISVKTIAEHLCSGVSFALLRKRNLVAESRDALLKTLQQKHGPQFQTHILKLQQLLHPYGPEEEQREVFDPLYISDFADEERPFSTDEFKTQTTGFTTSSFEKTSSVPFDWNFTDWSNPLDKTADWLVTPAENPMVLNDSFSRRCSPLFPVDFQFKDSFLKESDHFFTFSPTSSCVNDHKSSGHMEDFFMSTNRKESVTQTKNDLNFSDIRTLGYRRSPHSTIVNDHYSFDTCSSESALFRLQVHNSFDTHRLSYGKSLSQEIPYFHHKSSFEHFSHLGLPSANPNPVLLNPHIDLADFPPSHMLERNPSQSTSSCFPSPEHWSFPPMRLY